MKVHVLFFSENEYVESFDLASRECSVGDNYYVAEHFSKSEASYYAERLGCYCKEVEIEE